jgi:hypothetical protein
VPLRQNPRRARPSRLLLALIAVVLAVTVAALPAARASASVDNPSCGWTTAWRGPLPGGDAYYNVRWFASQLNDRCRQYYPLVVARLASTSLPDWHPRDSITFVFQWGGGIQTSAATGIVYLPIEYFNAYPHDWGAIMHELTHVAQNYPGGQPAFVVEGIADYIRFSLGGSLPAGNPPFESYDRARCPASEDYTSGYGCAAALLAYVQDVYHKDAPRAVHALGVRNQGWTYSSELHRLTGKYASTLWAECLHYERWCNNGR